jgi:hypothetical protein
MKKTAEEILKSNNIEIDRLKKDKPMLWHNLLKAMEQFGNLRYEEGKPKWIDLEKIFPAPGDIVLISNCNDKWVSTGHVDKIIGRWIWKDVTDDFCECYPTHWMPLPLPESPVKF